MNIPNNTYELATSTLLAFNRAVKAKDFKYFWQVHCSKAVQEQFTAEQLLEIFKVFIEKRIDIRSVKYYSPLFISAPEQRDEKLYLIGFYFFESQTIPNQISFSLEFQREGREYKVNSINISTDKVAVLPSNAVLMRLVEDTLLDLNKAILEDNFTFFSASYFQKTTILDSSTSPAKLRAAFEYFIENKIDISDIESYIPVFTEIPTIKDGVLSISGHYEKNEYPLKVHFNLSYFYEDLRWRLDSISLHVE